MDVINSYINAGNKQELLLIAVAVQAFLVFPFVICSFVVAGTANAGFNAVLTGFLNCALIGGSYYVLKNSNAPIAIGFLIGSSTMVTILNFMTAIYWGQLSHCKYLDDDISGYSCSNKSAYGAVCAFAVMLFLVQLVYTAALVLWRGELINETGLYDEISTASPNTVAFPYETPAGAPAPSADL